MPKGTIYAHENKLNKKVYVGQTWHYHNRCKSHKSDSLHRPTTKFHKALAKYGWDGFNHFILAEDEFSQTELDSLEIFWINYLQADVRGKGYNIKPGGNKGALPQETRDKIGAANRGRKHTEETRRKVSEAGKGKRRSAETKARIAKALQGNKYSLGKIWTPEEKERLSLRLKGHTKVTKGRKLSEETLRKRKESFLRNKELKQQHTKSL